MQKHEIGKKIIEVGSRFSGLYETKSNEQWSDKQLSNELLDMMLRTGWLKGQPYCASFVESVWVKAYTELKAPEKLIRDIRKILTPSVITSYTESKKIAPIANIPSVGSIFFMQLRNQWKGHSGLVVDYKSGTGRFKTLEGNTSASKSDPERDRNGDGIYIKDRTLIFKKSTTDLNLLGFLEPLEW